MGGVSGGVRSGEGRLGEGRWLVAIPKESNEERKGGIVVGGNGSD